MPTSTRPLLRRGPVVVSAVVLATVTMGWAAPSSARAQENRVGVNPPVTVVQDPDPTTPTTTPTTTAPTVTITEPTPTTTTTPATTTAPATSVPPSSSIAPDPSGASTASTSSTLPGSSTVGVGDTTTTVVSTPTDTGPVRAAGDVPVSTVPPVSATGATTTVPKSAKPAAAIPARTVAELQQKIDALLAPVPGVSASITLDGVGAVYSRNADRAVLPASTQKMYTLGAALLRLGGDYRFVTEVRSSALVDTSGTVTGDLVIRASGDPSFTSTGVNSLADAVVRAGVKRVTGDLVVDESRFDSRRTNEGWKPSFTPGEVGSLSAFSVNGNHQGGKALADPALTNLALVRTALAKRNVSVVGIDRRGVLGLGGPVLGSVSSAPLRDLASYAMKKSENTYAELLLKELGASAGNGSSAGGIEMIRQQFAAFGVSAPVMADGSGLSSLNRSTTSQQVAWLAKLRVSKAATEFRAALPVACVDGTLKSRLCKTPGSGRIQAKTGTLDNVTALAGFATLPSGKVATFSFIGNALPSSSRARTAIDQALIELITSTLA